MRGHGRHRVGDRAGVELGRVLSRRRARGGAAAVRTCTRINIAGEGYRRKLVVSGPVSPRSRCGNRGLLFAGAAGTAFGIVRGSRASNQSRPPCLTENLHSPPSAEARQYDMKYMLTLLLPIELVLVGLPCHLSLPVHLLLLLGEHHPLVLLRVHFSLSRRPKPWRELREAHLVRVDQRRRRDERVASLGWESELALLCGVPA